MDETERSASAASSRALDALNVFLADVRDGLGPYLAIYLTMRHWDPGRIGIAMSAMGIATVAAQTPAGALIDRTRHKRQKNGAKPAKTPCFQAFYRFRSMLQVVSFDVKNQAKNIENLGSPVVCR